MKIIKMAKSKKTEYIKTLKSLGADNKTIAKADNVEAYSSNASAKSASLSSTLSSTSHITSLQQQPQETYYWCGPATASEIIKSFTGVTCPQSYLASYLGTTTDGTPWYTNTYPMADCLNYFEHTTWYVPYGTEVNASMFKQHLVFDIDYERDIAGNTWEVGGSTHPHLTGHPQDRTIYHWIAIDGYLDGGTTVHYADSVNGSSISWAASCPKYATCDYEKMARILNGRGIIW